MPPLTGSCLCGAITLTIKDATLAREKGIHICHCTDCRKNTGALAAFFVTPTADQLDVFGTPAVYQHPGAASTVSRYFCGTCGSPLYGIVSRFADLRFVHGGIFPPGTLPPPHSEIWRKNAEAWEPAYEVQMLLDTQP